MNICVLSPNIDFFFNFAQAKNMRINRNNLQAFDGEKVYIYCDRKERIYGIKFKEIMEIGTVNKELKNFALSMVR